MAAEHEVQGSNPPSKAYSARVALLRCLGFFFLLIIIRGIKWNLIGTLALSCPQRRSC